MTWTRAIHLTAWADEINARHTFPRLLRRLVRTSVPRLAEVNFPSDEQVRRPGVDGVIRLNAQSPILSFVPPGDSVWELGVGKDPEKKANDDFANRKNEFTAEFRERATFVFVTPRPWDSKDGWAREKKASSDWKAVIVHDSNDLEQWIESCPAADAWFMTECGHVPEGVYDLSHRWTALQCDAAYRLLPDIGISGRERVCDALESWHAGPASSVLLQTRSASDGIDFLTAFLGGRSEDTPLGDRCLVVETLSAWRSLASERHPATLIMPPSLSLASNEVAAAVANGHHVLIVGTESASEATSVLELPWQDVYGVEEALKRCGFDDASAHTHARIGGGSFSVLRRRLATHPDREFPGWSQQGSREILAPFALVGAWRHVVRPPRDNSLLPTTTPVDIDVVAALVEVTPDVLEQLVARHSTSDEPLFLRIGHAVYIGSREDAWYLLGGLITPRTLDRFVELAGLLLDENDPALELEAEQRWLANVYGRVRSISAELRKGLLESLVLMAVWRTAHSPTTNLRALVRSVLETVLPVGAGWQRWATHDRDLTLFAEADPAFLLGRIEHDLDSANPQIPQLFAQGGDGMTGPGSYHCGMLWALESLAWAPEHFARATEMLARLGEHQALLRSNVGNRPCNSLQEIFRWWLPHTMAPISQRIEALRRIVATSPNVGWGLLASLLPDSLNETSTGTHMPRWRRWAYGWSHETAQREARTYLTGIVDLAIELANGRPERWASVIPGVFCCSAEATELALTTLERTAASAAASEAAGLWRELDSLVRRHRAYSDAGWALDESVLERIAHIAQSIRPNDPVMLNAWLFDAHPDFPHDHSAEGYARCEAELNDARTDAIREIYAHGGMAALDRLNADERTGHLIGWLAGSNAIMPIEDVEPFSRLDSTEPASFALATSYLAGRFHREQFQFLDSIDISLLNVETASVVLRSTPFRPEVWQWIDQNVSSDLRDRYWAECRVLFSTESLEELTYLVHRLMEARRPFAAADVLQMCARHVAVSDEVIFDVLEAGHTVDRNVERADRLDVYATRELIGRLQSAGADRKRLARLEWQYLPVLDPEVSQTSPQTLIKELQSNAEMFVELLKLLFRAEGDPPRQTEATDFEQQQRQSARDLLEAFGAVPGLNLDGTVDEECLRSWISDARRLAEECRRLGVADSQIGKLLSRFRRSDDQPWPPDAVCRVMEATRSEALFRGFICGAMSDRNMIWRGAFDGGERERIIATRYRGLATHHRDKHPRVSAAFDQLAQHFDDRADDEDDRAERNRLGH